MLKTVIVGAGAIAYAHAAAVTKLGIEILGVYDIRAEAAMQLASKFDSVALNSIEEYVRLVEHADMVHLCTPPSLRIAYAEVAMKAGCHIVTEKPMAISMEDAQALLGMASRYGVKIMVDFNHRFRDGFQKLLEPIRSGRIGDVIDVFVHRIAMLGGNAGTQNDTWRRNPGTVCGMSIESLSHDIDMMIQIAGAVKDVKANIRGTFYDVPDFDNNVQATFNMQGGAMGSIHASWSSQIKTGMRGVIGTKGAVILEGDDLFDFTRLRLKTQGMDSEEIITINDIYNLKTCPSYFNANRHFVDCIENGKESTASGVYAFETLKISHAILNSARTGEMIRIK